MLSPFPTFRVRLILCFAFGGWAIQGNGQSASYCNQAKKLVKTIESFHYAPHVTDSALLNRIAENFIASLDGTGYYLTEADRDALKAAPTSLQGLMEYGQCDYLQKSEQIFQQRCSDLEQLLLQLETNVLNYNQPDTLFLDSTQAAENTTDYSERWKQLIKYRVWDSYFSDFDTLPSAPRPTGERMAVLQRNVVSLQLCHLNNLKDSTGSVGEFVAAALLDAIATSYDPHTTYFTPLEENVFEDALSSSRKSFGFSVSINAQNELEIDRLVPASPAWKSNRFNVGDVILEVRTAQKTINADCSSWHELADLLMSAATEEAVFVLRKVDRNKAEVKLIKEEQEAEDNRVQGFILDAGKRVGYLYLPSFYSQMDNYQNAPNGCAHDVALELLRLKGEGIQGLVLDLRNNGGGFLMEASLLAGIFLDYGAMSLVCTKGQAIETLKDMNRGVLYNDPLVVLVNGNSASASELLAATLQDHHRALVVGAPTFGKATMQEIMPVEAGSKELSTRKPEGFVKVTTGCFYRVTGQTHQKTGVIPDIILPGLNRPEDVREQDLSGVLTLKPVEKKTYYYPRPELPVEALKAKSASRVQHDTVFQCQLQVAQWKAEQEQIHQIPLYFDAFQRYYKQNQQPRCGSTRSWYTVSNPAHLRGLNSISESDKEMNEDIMIQIKNDPYVGEALHIVTDYLNLEKLLPDEN